MKRTRIIYKVLLLVTSGIISYLAYEVYKAKHELYRWRQLDSWITIRRQEFSHIVRSRSKPVQRLWASYCFSDHDDELVARLDKNSYVEIDFSEASRVSAVPPPAGKKYYIGRNITSSKAIEGTERRKSEDLCEVYKVGETVGSFEVSRFGTRGYDKACLIFAMDQGEIFTKYELEFTLIRTRSNGDTLGDQLYRKYILWKAS